MIQRSTAKKARFRHNLARRVEYRQLVELRSIARTDEPATTMPITGEPGFGRVPDGAFALDGSRLVLSSAATLTSSGPFLNHELDHVQHLRL